MDPFDKSQTDPIWQRVWNRQPSSSPSRPAPPQSPAPPVTPQPVLSPPEMSWTPQELLRQAWEEEGFGRQCQALSRSMGTGGREALLRLNRGLRQVLPSPCPWRGRYAFGPAWDESWSARG